MPRLTRHYPYSRPASLPFGSTFVFGSVVQIFLPSEAVGDGGWRLPLRINGTATVKWLLRLVLRLVGLLPHPELQLQQVGLGTASGFGLIPIAIVEGLTAVIERVDDILALVLLERVLLQAVFLQVSLRYGYTLLFSRREKTDPELRTGWKVRQVSISRPNIDQREDFSQRTARGWHGGFDCRSWSSPYLIISISRPRDRRFCVGGLHHGCTRI